MRSPEPPDSVVDPSLRRRIEARLRAFEVRPHDAGAQPRAAVALAIADEGSGAALPGLADPAAWSRRPALILTRRAGHLRRHAGQWALPGGRIDAGETAEAAALRELVEEVGLGLEPAAVLGRLDDYTTRSGFVITPVVVWAGTARELRPNPDEVASVHRILFAEFRRADAPLLDPPEPDRPLQPVLRMPVGTTWIAAPTAAVLYQFREVCLEDRATRVAHFDQPRFAWK